MKILKLIQASIGVPFYHLKPGAFFQIVTVSESGEVRPRSEYLYEDEPILMKVDSIGAMDFPYDLKSDEMVQYIHENQMVHVVKKTERIYKNYLLKRVSL